MNSLIDPSHRLNQLGAIILDSAISVHKAFGPGLLESVYQKALLHELLSRELDVKTSVGIDLVYKGNACGKGYLIDMLVEDAIIIEIKSVEELHEIHKAQLMTYLKLSQKKLGYLINFNELLLKDGFHRVVMNF